MTNEKDRDDDIATRRQEGQSQPTTRDQGKSIFDDTISEIGKRSPLRTPIGRDFLDDDLPPLTDPPPRPRLRESYRDLDLDLDRIRKPAARSALPGDAQAPQADQGIRDPLADLPIRDTLTERPRDIGTDRRPSEAVAPLAARTGSRPEERAPQEPPAPPPSPPSPQVQAEETGAGQSRSGGKLIAALVALAVVIVAGGLWYWLQSGSTGAAPTTKAAAPAGEPIRNAFYDQIEKSGLKSCSRVFPRLGQATTLGSTYSLQASWNKDIPASHGILAVTGLSYNRPDLKTSGAGVVFAAPVPGGCEGTAVRVITVPTPCSVVAQSQLPPGSTRSDDLSGIPLYELANGVGKLMLLPATENACAVITVALGEE